MILDELSKIRKSKKELAILVAILLFAGILRFYNTDVGYFSYHVSRDLYRAEKILTEFDVPFWGSEMQYGGRTFGPLVYFLYAIPLAVSCTAFSVTVFVALVSFASVLLTYIFTRRYFGVAAAIAAGAFYSFFPLEISQIRFYWNPTFLPLMVLIFAWGLYAVVTENKQWGLIASIIAIIFAFNLHFSALDLIPMFIIALILNRGRFKKKTTAVAIIVALILLLPPILGALTSQFRNIKAVVDVPYARQDKEQRVRFNPHSVKVFSRHLHFAMEEPGIEQGFVYLGFYTEYLEKNDIETPAWVSALGKFGYIQLLLWAIGLFVAVVRGFNIKRLGALVPAVELSRSRCYFLLLPWQLIPVLILSFFNLHPPAPDFPDAPSIVPVRYLLVTYPATFITMAVGVAWLIDFFRRRKLEIARICVIGCCVVLLAWQFVFCVSYINLMARSGKSIPYAGFVPNLREMTKIADTLVDDFRIHPDDYYTRVFSQGVLTWRRGEASLDWFITQNPKAWDNPPMDKDLYVMLYEDGDEDFPSDDFEIVKSRKLKDINVALFRAKNRDNPPAFDNKQMRNYFIERMDLMIPPWQRDQLKIKN